MLGWLDGFFRLMIAHEFAAKLIMGLTLSVAKRPVSLVRLVTNSSILFLDDIKDSTSYEPFQTTNVPRRAPVDARRGHADSSHP
jgi:hypothetical protein